MGHLFLVITNEDLMKQILKMETIRTIDMTIIPPLIVAISSLIATWISNYFSGKNMERQIEEQRRISQADYEHNEILQRHDFINKLVLERLTELVSLLPQYYRESLVLYTRDIYTYYNNKKYLGIDNPETIESGKKAINNISVLANQLNTNSLKIKQLLAYSEKSERDKFDKLDTAMARFTILGIDKYVDDIRLGVVGKLDPESVRKELHGITDPLTNLFIEISKSVDEQIIALVNELRT